MKINAFTQFTMTYLPVAGMFVFLAIFIAACIWVWRKGSHEFYSELSKIPFEKDIK